MIIYVENSKRNNKKRKIAEIGKQIQQGCRKQDEHKKNHLLFHISPMNNWIQNK